jgi:hypothetical protein
VTQGALAPVGAVEAVAAEMDVLARPQRNVTLARVAHVARNAHSGNSSSVAGPHHVGLNAAVRVSRKKGGCAWGGQLRRLLADAWAAVVGA